MALSKSILSPKPSLIAYSNLAQVVNNLPYTGRFDLGYRNMAAFLFGSDSPPSSVLVLWSAGKEETIILKLPKGIKTEYDLFGNPKILSTNATLKLDDDMAEAIRKMVKMEEILASLPGLDCGSCGAPNCQALAEDVVRGLANEMDCVFKLRERVAELAGEMMELAKKAPPAMGHGEKKSNDSDTEATDPGTKPESNKQ